MKRELKRLMYIAMLLCLSVLFSGCDEKTQKSDSAIAEAKLSEREKELLRTVTDQYFVCDYKVDPSYKTVTVWVEKYQSGKKVGEKLAHMTAEVKESGTLTYATSKTTEDQDTAFITGIDGNSSASSVVEHRLERSASILGSNPEPLHPSNGELILASLSYGIDGSELRSLSTDFYRNSEINIDELQNYDTVYLFKSKFTQ